MIKLTADIDSFSEPLAKLEKIKTRLDKYVGRQVVVSGGGGYSGSWVTLSKIEIHPTIVRDHDGYIIRAYLSNCEPGLSYDGNGTFNPWLGSWQLSVNDS